MIIKKEWKYEINIWNWLRKSQLTYLKLYLSYDRSKLKGIFLVFYDLAKWYNLKTLIFIETPKNQKWNLC